MTQPRRFYAWREVLDDVRAFFDEVERNDVSVVIERHGRPAYVLNPVPEFVRGWMSGAGADGPTFTSDEVAAEVEARAAADELVRAGQELERNRERDASADYDGGHTYDDKHRVPRRYGDPRPEPTEGTKNHGNPDH